MCELLGMNCNVPTDICFSFTGFRERGGATNVHADGWGIAFFEGQGARLFLDPTPSAQSPLAEWVKAYPIHSTNVIAHIRKATKGAVGLENTHPFCRELWGRYWIFAHNGDLKNFYPTFNGSVLPVGKTDSERAFCLILQTLRARFHKAPSEEALFESICQITLEIAEFGECNFLLSQGDSLFAHASTRLSYIVRQAPFQTAHLKDQDLSVDFQKVTSDTDRVAIVATLPLTDDEIWNEIPAGTLCEFKDGALIRQAQTKVGVRATP